MQPWLSLFVIVRLTQAYYDSFDISMMLANDSLIAVTNDAIAAYALGTSARLDSKYGRTFPIELGDGSEFRELRVVGESSILYCGDVFCR